MCNGFGLVYWQDGVMEFITPDFDGDISHSDIYMSSGRNSESTTGELFTRNNIKIEFPYWTEESFRVDERGTLPPWADEAEIKEKSVKLFLRVKEAWDLYNESKQRASDEYIAVTRAERKTWEDYVEANPSDLPTEESMRLYRKFKDAVDLCLPIKRQAVMDARNTLESTLRRIPGHLVLTD